MSRHDIEIVIAVAVALLFVAFLVWLNASLNRIVW